MVLFELLQLMRVFLDYLRIEYLWHVLIMPLTNRNGISTFIVAVFCLVDDRLKDRGPLRQRGPTPKLSDAEVLTIEIVGEFLGIDTDKALHSHFRRHYGEWFPALGEVHRTTFARQAANLWKVKELLWQELLTLAPHDPAFAICDSLPLPACLFARAYRCRRFRGEAAFGKDTLLKQTFYGFRVHVRVCWPGVITLGSSPASRWPRPTPTSFPCSPNSPSLPLGWLSGIATTTRPRPGRSWRAWGSSCSLHTPPRRETRIPKRAPSSVGFATG